MSWPVAAFGDVGFWVVMDDDQLMQADWQQESRTAEYAVPGSDRVVMQTLGRGRYRATWEIELESDADLRALRALLQTTQTLRLPHNTSTLQATEVVYMGRVYDELSDVLLERVDDVRMHAVGRWVRCTVTLSRSAA